MHFFEAFLPDAHESSVEVMEGVSLKGRVGWIINKCITLNESLKPVIHLKHDPTLKSTNPFTFRFLPLMAINGVLQVHVRPLLGGILENEALLATTNSHLIMGFTCPEGFTVWVGSVRDIGILDGALLNCHVMFKLETGWTHMAVFRFYPTRKASKFDYRVRHLSGPIRFEQDIFFDCRKYGHGKDACLSTWCLLRPI